MYRICCVPLVKNTFFKSPPLPKKRSDCESQKSGLGFYGFMIRFWIRITAKYVFGFGNQDLNFPKKKNAPLVETVQLSTSRQKPFVPIMQ